MTVFLYTVMKREIINSLKREQKNLLYIIDGAHKDKAICKVDENRKFISQIFEN